MPDIDATDINLNADTAGINPGNPGKPVPELEPGAGSPLAAGYAGKMDALTADMEKEGAAQEKETGPYKEKLLSVLNSPAAAHAHMEQVQEAPKPEDYRKYSMEFAGAMAVMGALAGRFTRNAGNASLNAFAGALKGWQSGNLQAYETAAKEWEQNTKKTLENNQIELDKYKQVMEDKKLNIDQMMASMNIIATEHQNKIMFDATMAKNYTLALNAADKMAANQTKTQTSFDKLQEVRQKQQAETKASVEDLNAHPEKVSQMPLKDYQKLKGDAEVLGLTIPDQVVSKGGTPRSANAMAVQKFMEEHPDATAEQLQEFTAHQAELSSAGRTKGTRETNLDIILRVTDSAIPAALAASDKVPRGKWVPLNEIIQKGQVATSNTELAQFGMANLQLAEGWARAMNPTGVMRESDRDKALSFLSTATSQQTYKALVEQLRTQIQRERAAIQSGKATAVSAPGEVPSVSESSGDGWTDLGNGVRIREKP